MFYTDKLKKIIYCTKWFLEEYFTRDTSLHVKEINLFNIMFLSLVQKAQFNSHYRNWAIMWFKACAWIFRDL